jgi:hypothetical protein
MFIRCHSCLRIEADYFRHFVYYQVKIFIHKRQRKAVGLAVCLGTAFNGTSCMPGGIKF